jgi:hypothetical protein
MDMLDIRLSIFLWVNLLNPYKNPLRWMLLSDEKISMCCEALFLQMKNEAERD